MKAAIDIGTNTVLLLVGEISGGKLHVIHEEERAPRLGRNVDANKTLHEDSMLRVIAALKEYQEILSSRYPDVKEIIVTATSAVRDAANKQTFMDLVLKETGLRVRLLSGQEEAVWTYKGALSVLEGLDKHETFVLDIGGGSTEIALGKYGILNQSHSYDMGCVRFTERYLKHEPPFQEEIMECKGQIKNILSNNKFKPKRNVRAIGVAGTVTSLAAINMQLDEYEPSRINGHTIERDKLSKGIEIFSLHTYSQLLELSPTFLRGREDIFLAGLLILEGFLNFYKLDKITVSTGGIRHGAIIMSKEK